MPFSRSDVTIVFSFGKARMVDETPMLPAPMAMSEKRPKRSWMEVCGCACERPLGTQQDAHNTRRGLAPASGRPSRWSHR
eukprot:scaffold248419_cov28-Tisochrysis_lutea.AAC.4